MTQNIIQVMNPPYRAQFLATGTDVTFDSATPSATVTGTGTAFLTELRPGWFIRNAADPEHDFRAILSIESDVSLTLAGNYAGTDGAAGGITSAEIAIRRPVGRQQSPGDVGEYVNVGDIGLGTQVPIPPGAIQHIPVNAPIANYFQVRDMVAQGSVVISQDAESLFQAAGPAMDLLPSNIGIYTRGDTNISVNLGSDGPTGGWTLEFSTDNGGSWSTLTATGGSATANPAVALAGTRTGTVHVTTWDSATDIPGSEAAVLIRLNTLTESAGTAVGFTTQIGPFAVNNS